MAEQRGAYRVKRTKVQPYLGSSLERSLETQLIAAGVGGWLQEHKFHPVRKWRFDFAWPGAMLAVELEGGTWTGGGHNRGKYYEDNCTKYNEAVLLGWRVLRFTTDQVHDGTALRYIEAALR